MSIMTGFFSASEGNYIPDALFSVPGNNGIPIGIMGFSTWQLRADDSRTYGPPTGVTWGANDAVLVFSVSRGRTGVINTSPGLVEVRQGQSTRIIAESDISPNVFGTVHEVFFVPVNEFVGSIRITTTSNEMAPCSGLLITLRAKSGSPEYISSSGYRVNNNSTNVPSFDTRSIKGALMISLVNAFLRTPITSYPYNNARGYYTSSYGDNDTAFDSKVAEGIASDCGGNYAWTNSNSTRTFNSVLAIGAS